MAWMTYISNWFEQDDWYEGLRRVRYIYVVFMIFRGFLFLLYYSCSCISLSFMLQTVLHCDILRVNKILDRFQSRGKKII